MRGLYYPPARTLAVARTLAALGGRAEPATADADEALSFRRGLPDLKAPD